MISASMVLLRSLDQVLFPAIHCGAKDSSDEHERDERPSPRVVPGTPVGRFERGAVKRTRTANGAPGKFQKISVLDFAA